MAHIVAFSKKGPRGTDRDAVSSTNDVANLMLLCHRCHKLIDDHPQDYPRSVLEKFKKKHEDRIHHVTGLGPDLRTAVLQLKANIGGQTVAIPVHQVTDAVAPRYPLSRTGLVIDLTGAEGDDEAYLATATATIDRKLRQLYDSDEVHESRHISLFALAPIPLLTVLGSKLSNKVPVEVFQRHRDTEDWTWKTDGNAAEYTLRQLQEGADRRQVALVLCLSGLITSEALPNEIDSSFSIYEIRLQGQAPNPSFLRQRLDLESFRRIYSHALSTIISQHQGCREIHLFPAVPAPVAVLCGRELLPKVYPALVVYDNDKAKGGFTSQVRINDHDN